MLQWASWSGDGPRWLRGLPFDGWIDFGGVHVDFRHRRGPAGKTYGPYIDLHLGVLILSLGWHPVYAGDLDLRTSVAIARELG